MREVRCCSPIPISLLSKYKCNKVKGSPLPVIRKIFMVAKGASASTAGGYFNTTWLHREDMSVRWRKVQLRIAVVLCGKGHSIKNVSRPGSKKFVCICM